MYRVITSQIVAKLYIGSPDYSKFVLTLLLWSDDHRSRKRGKEKKTKQNEHLTIAVFS
jgi:hypothetical protein